MNMKAFLGLLGASLMAISFITAAPSQENCSCQNCACAPGKQCGCLQQTECRCSNQCQCKDGCACSKQHSCSAHCRCGQ
ncbi:hypothetical secreted protein [Candidatus Protochlamydia naegleriophila]|uniref:Hypothetical secreted protein n=1 Tax=Candidatus Protochlamydia naegleriophila TaxID=389348 RepID=A0A0U5ER25_9BACT|nr:hypothetical protein [Candidatus Protochlamydia naegleriophila]CUI16611.1 hypothetical secreted protein [Candidatus Protochlamydia naegleriophila]